VSHRARSPAGRKGIEGLKQRLTLIRTAFPDVHITIEDVVANGDKVTIGEVGTQQQWHADIKDKEVVVMMAGYVIASEAIRGPLRFHSFAFKDLLQQLAGGLVIVDNQSAHVPFPPGFISAQRMPERGDLKAFHHPVERTAVDIENLCRTREIPLGAAQDITHVAFSDLIESRVAGKE
jgi:SnoaL-like polyketide cyclase